MIKIYEELDQGSDEWLAARCGILTASEVKLIVTPTGKPANNDNTRAHVYELAAQRITKYVEPAYISDDMLRGMMDEATARDLYSGNYALAKEVGFITNDSLGFTMGYSPDGLVGDDGLVEIKSRRQKFQIESIVTNEVPKEHKLQLQTGLLVSGREWVDYISYSAGLPLFVKRVFVDGEMRANIIEAAKAFEKKVTETVWKFRANSKSLVKTERNTDPDAISIL